MNGRPACFHIDLDALRHNHRLLKARHGGQVLAVLKADAYGHGAVACAQALADEADGFAVAFVDEALALRAHGIAQPILVLEGAFDAAELARARAHGLWLVVHTHAQLQALEALRDTPASGARPLAIWLKVDTGMGRLGFGADELASVFARLQACAAVGHTVLMTHLARADEPQQVATLMQLARFDQATQGIDAPHSIANSAGILAWAPARRDWGRAGLALYGVHPMPAGGPGLRPVMRACSRVFAQRWLAEGDALGYGGGFVATRPTRIGLVAFGYADGYPRSAPAGTPVEVGGVRVPLVGRVSMDMLTVDLTAHPELGPGSAVTLWGGRVGVEEVARAALTIPYELLCHAQRAPRVHRCISPP